MKDHALTGRELRRSLIVTAGCDEELERAFGADYDRVTEDDLWVFDGLWREMRCAYFGMEQARLDHRKGRTDGATVPIWEGRHRDKRAAFDVAVEELKGALAAA